MKKQNQIKQLVDKSIAKGWKMNKKISSGGFFSYATYDERMVYSRKDLWRLHNEGFKLDEDSGNLAINILLKIDE